MGILIKNPETERKARELASLRGQTLTSVIDQALEKELAVEKARPRRTRDLARMRDATDRLRHRLRLDEEPMTYPTKADWDAIWATGVHEFGDI